MFIWFIVAVQAHSCETELSQLLTKEFIPRTNAFHSAEKGLDYIESFSICKQTPNSTYAAVLWISSGMYEATFGICLPSECSKTSALKILEAYVQGAKIKSSSYLIEFDKKTKMGQSGKFFLFFFFLIFYSMVPE